MKSSDTSLIAARRKEIADAKARHKEALAALDLEDAELATAERVLTRLMQEAQFREMAANGHAEAADAEAALEGGEVARPPGIPTMPEMIREALSQAQAQGYNGLKPAGLLSFVRAKYWPNAPQSSVGPTAWRMAKRGEIKKHGPNYKLPKKDSENSEAASEVSPAA
ncbi:MAG: hypothetical protein KIT16_18775 [Rhodospirillaceae bacterium]|nr:hypothetical protein [Rhodospirillaceae bacterium]